MKSICEYIDVIYMLYMLYNHLYVHMSLFLCVSFN